MRQHAKVKRGALECGFETGSPTTRSAETDEVPSRRRRQPTVVAVALAALVVTVLGPFGLDPVAASPAQDGGIDRIDVSLRDQRVRIWARDGTLVRDVPVSTGSRGRTPRGTFRVYNRLANTVSTADNISTMKWMVSFNGGIGFHGIPRKYGREIYTPLGERPVSAGCVRMSDGDAEWIYRNVANGTPVTVK